MQPLSRFLVRAPLLPLASLRRPVDAVLRHPLAAQALGALPADAARAREGYARRAAFRPTPHGLWAGVLLGRLGKTARVATGEPRPHYTVRWSDRQAQARARLSDDPVAREASRLCVAPSLTGDDRQVSWLALGEDGAAQAALCTAEVDEPLARALDAARDWAPWPAVRAAAGADDDWLLRLVDDGLLVSSLEPPLIGPCVVAERPEGAHAVLTFDGEVVLPRAAVERAARLVPLLHRLQSAMAPPVAERDLARPPSLDAVTEVFGAGALDVAALARGDYGVLTDDEPPRPPTAVPPALLALLAERVARGDADFSSEELDVVTPPSDPPPTCELFLQPTHSARGDGWLVGLHAPAGASWGRFAHALGAPLVAALTELSEAESRARPGEEPLDVSFAPTRALADLAAHPPIRRAALSLLGWPERALGLSSLELVADGAALEPLALRAGGAPIRPSPLHRLRSTTAPPGLGRLLLGWSLERQHAPWAFQWGPLADLERLPRVTIDGLVVAPASWRLPGVRNAAELRRWRRALDVPRFVQVGREDELLWIDLEAAGAHDRLARLDGRVWEIWPPLSETPDRDGRRLEAVVALVDDSPSERTHAAIAATAAAGRVEPPAVDGPAPDWISLKLFGAPDRADGVLLGVVAGLIDDARRAGELDRWFFLRYVDPPGRPHLRLRLLPKKSRAPELLLRVEERLQPARACGDVVAVERGDYFREYARYGRDSMDLVERVFEIDSDLALALYDDCPDFTDRSVISLDTLASGREPDTRRELAGRRRRAHEAELTDDLAPEYRARQRRLLELLADPPSACRTARERLPDIPDRLLPALLHLCMARRNPAEEARSYYFWERALDGLTHRSRKPGSRREP